MIMKKFLVFRNILFIIMVILLLSVLRLGHLPYRGVRFSAAGQAASTSIYMSNPDNLIERSNIHSSTEVPKLLDGYKPDTERQRKMRIFRNIMIVLFILYFMYFGSSMKRY